MTDQTTITAIDGTDALAFVIIRPGKTEGGVEIEAVANGMSKPGAAYVLRHVANQWDGGGDDPSATLSALNTLAERYEAIVAKATSDVAKGRVRQIAQVARDIRTVLTTGQLPGYLAAAAPLGTATEIDEEPAS
jgi:hypothetical protein